MKSAEDLHMVMPKCEAGKVLNILEVDTCSNTYIPADVTDNTDIRVDKSFREKMRENEYKKNFFHTVSLCSAFFTLGVVGGQRGPSLLDLQMTTGADTQGSSLFITAMSTGYTCGSLVTAFLYDRSSKPLLLFASTLTTGLLTGLIPFCSNYILMLGIIFLGAMPMAAIDIGGNADIIRIWGKEGHSYLQAVHFCFAVGSVLGPLVTEPFLTPRQSEENPPHMALPMTMQPKMGEMYHYNTTTKDGKNRLDLHLVLKRSTTHLSFKNTTHLSFKNTTRSSFQNTSMSSSFQNITTHSPFQNTSMPSSFQNITTHSPFQNTSMPSSFQNITTHSPFQNSTLPNRTTVVYIAYIIVGAACVVISLTFLLLHFQQQSAGREKHNVGNIKNNYRKNSSLKIISITLVIIVFLNIFYIAIEDTMANFMLMFVVNALKWTKAEGTLVTSTYWVAFAISRFLGIFLIRCLSPSKCLFVVYSFLIISCTGLLFSALHSFHIGVWMTITGTGLSLGVIYPTNYNLISEHVTVSGKIASLMSITASIGSIGNPAILGPLMQRYSPMWYVYLILGESICCLVCFLVLLVFTRNHQQELMATDSQTVVVSDVMCELIANKLDVEQNTKSETL